MAISAQEILLVVKAKDEASATLNSVSKTAQNVGKNMGNALKMGGLAAAAGIGAAGFALAGFVKDAAAEQVGIQRLQTAIKTLDAAHRGSADAVEEVVRANERLAFADDDIRASMALLIVQTGDYDEAVRRQSIAQDLARGTGMELAMASKLVGKVNEDNVQVLKKYGITLRDGASETEALAEIQRLFGGQSAAYAETATAKWEIFNNQIDNLKESIGAALLPTVTKLGEALGNFLIKHQPDIDRFSQSMSEKLPKAIDEVTKAIAPLVPHLKTITEDVLAGWETILASLLPKVQEFGQFLKEHEPLAIALGVALAAVVAILIGWPVVIAATLIAAGLLVEKLGEWREENEDLDASLTALEVTVTTIQTSIRALTQFIEDHKSAQIGLKIVFDQVVNAMAPFIGQFQFAKGVVDTVRQALEWTTERVYWLRDAFYALRDAISEALDELNLVGNFKDKLGGLVPGVKQITSRIPDPNIPSFGFAKGTPYVPRDMLALVHQGERIIPADENRRLSARAAALTTRAAAATPSGVAGNTYNMDAHIVIEGNASPGVEERIRRVMREEWESMMALAQFGGMSVNTAPFAP